jgi:uncharacterized protein (DUF362 family)
LEDVVALVKHEGDLSVGSRSKSLKKAIGLIGGFGSLKSPFVIKPNLVTHPSRDVTGFACTKVDMVEALLGLVLQEQKGLSLKIVESNSVSKFADEETFEGYGYKGLEERLKKEGFDISLVNLSDPPLSKIIFDGLYFKELELHQLLIESNYFVSVAVAKTHPLTNVTGVIKNLFGLLPRKNKPFYHSHINDVIIDLNRFVKPDLCIVDAIVGMEGVERGRTRRVNALIVGKKSVSVDATMARIMGFQPERIRHLVIGEKYGLGTLNPKVVGDSIDSLTVKFKPPSTLRPTALID